MKIHDGIACIACDGYCFEKLIELDVDGKKISCEAFVCEWCQEPVMNANQMQFVMKAYKEHGKKKDMIRKRKEKVKLQKSKRFEIEKVKGFNSVFSETKGK